MPHQVNIFLVSFGPRILLQRPTLTALLGNVVGEWAVLEDDIRLLYADLMGTYLPRSVGSKRFMHPVASQVFESLESTRLRINLLTKLAGWVLEDAAMLKELKKDVVKAIERAAKLRNTMVHAKWGIADEYPKSLILQPALGPSMAYDEVDFRDAIDRIIKAQSIVAAFHEKASKYLDRKAQTSDQNKIRQEITAGLAELTSQLAVTNDPERRKKLRRLNRELQMLLKSIDDLEG